MNKIVTSDELAQRFLPQSILEALSSPDVMTSIIDSKTESVDDLAKKILSAEMSRDIPDITVKVKKAEFGIEIEKIRLYATGHGITLTMFIVLALIIIISYLK